MSRWKNRLRSTLIILVLLPGLLPIGWTILASIELLPDNSVSPPQWSTPSSIERYLEVGVTEHRFGLELLTGTVLAIVVTLIATTIAFFAAFALARSRFRGRRIVVQSFLILASLPVISYLMPLRDWMARFHLYGNFTATALAEAALFAPLAAFVLYGYFNRASSEPEEAAYLEGATIGQMIGRIVLPMAAPGVAATAIIVFVLSWNQVLLPLILTTPIHTIPVAMLDFFTFERELEWPTAAAALMVSLLPVVLAVGLAQGWLERFSLNVESDGTSTEKAG